MATYRMMVLVAVLGICLPACGIHVTSDPVIVKHEVSFDVEGMANYCESVCDGDQECFDDCLHRFVDLLSDPDLCQALNSCPKASY